jgi:Peptidase M15
LILGAALSVGVATQASAKVARRAPLELNVFGPARALTDTAWLVDRVGKNRRFELGPQLTLLERYEEPERDRTPEWQSFWHGRYGRNNFELHPKLVWLGGASDEANDAAGGSAATETRWSDARDDSFGFALGLREPSAAQPFDVSRADVLPDWSLGIEAPEPEFASASQRKYCPRWKLPRAVSVARYDGAEWARQPLVDCGGAIAPDALDKLSALARPPATPKPELPLPLEPDSEASGGEWLPRVKLLHPRVIWAVEKIAEAFPNRTIFIMSGYRRDAHGSYHQKGRALDLYVTGVDNADLFRFCRTLNDVGCGFYPNNKFVHVDVRPFGTHRVAWVDISEPGEPSQYVTSWPGVLGSASELSAAAAE